MDLADLEAAIRDHAGEFLCARIGDEATTQRIPFVHRIEPATGTFDVPATGGLDAFHARFGSLLLYFDEATGQAARHLAHPSRWPALRREFGQWLEGLDARERRELLPGWIDTCEVIGDIPGSGNYLLVPTEGAERGAVFEFDHDGFEFVRMAPDIVEYVQRWLDPDGPAVALMATHMRFIGDDPGSQWWIVELRDNRGRVVRTTG